MIIPEVIPRERRNVGKATLWLAFPAFVWNGWASTVDFVFHPFAIAHRQSPDPVARKHRPRDDAKSVPGEIHQRRFRIP